jgi:hypothetical protein
MSLGNGVTKYFCLLAIAACSLANDVDKHGAEYVSPSSCTSAQKFCGGACRNADDPAVGCGEPGCAPCAEFSNATAKCGGDGLCALGTCNAGFADCNGDPNDGCEIKLEANPSHCGRCGRSCGGGACNGTTCEAITMARAQPSPGEIAIDDTHVYWSNYGAGADRGSIARVAKAGGDPQVIAGAQDNAWGIAVAGTEVFWATNTTPHTVARAPKDGSVPAAPLSSTAGRARGVAADAEFVFFCNYDANGTGHLGRVRRQGGAIDTFAAAKPNDVMIDGNDVYWSNEGATPGTGSIVRLARGAAAGTAPTEIARQQNRPRGLAADATHVYWVTTDATDGQVLRVPKGGGTPEALVSNLKNPREIALDDEHAYFTSYADGTVQRVKKAGGQPETLIGEQASPLGIAVDANYIYWVNYATQTTGAVMRLAKP